jgi:Ca2+-binding EF-hand superfamily protein
MYKGSANAFNAFDFTGRGYITEEDLANKYLLLRANITADELRLAS